MERDRGQRLMNVPFILNARLLLRLEGAGAGAN
jgi:hypothetical protein